MTTVTPATPIPTAAKSGTGGRALPTAKAAIAHALAARIVAITGDSSAELNSIMDDVEGAEMEFATVDEIWDLPSADKGISDAAEIERISRLRNSSKQYLLALGAAYAMGELIAEDLARKLAALRSDAAEFPTTFHADDFAYEPFEFDWDPQPGHSAVRHGGPRYDAATGQRKAT
jgi:hypothetical protein